MPVWAYVKRTRRTRAAEVERGRTMRTLFALYLVTIFGGIALALAIGITGG